MPTKIEMKYPSLCSGCISGYGGNGNGVTMLSGYCITACHCDGCGRIGDLAMCKITGEDAKNEPPTENKPLSKVEKIIHNLREMLSPSPLLYSLVAKRSNTGERAYFRFFVVCGGQILEVTPGVGRLVSDMGTLKDCGDYFAIYTHATNAQDIVQMVSWRLYGDDNKISHQRL